MSHVYAYGQQCPGAAGIIHLGATSCYVGDNTDVIIMTEALQLIRNKLVGVIRVLSHFAQAYKDLPTLAFTHFQPAQPTTVGKRATLWIQDLLMDLEDVEYQLSKAKLLGCKGTTGTQASFLELFEGDHQKCRQLDEKIAQKMGYDKCFPVSGQTYSRKLDSQMLNLLSGIAQSAAKFSNDIRLLQHLKEVEEPFEKGQIGSSAMAYKRNPMRSERIASLARYVIADAVNPAMTMAAQWFERTLDDSANKRISVPEAFLAVDGILNLYNNVADGLVVQPPGAPRAHPYPLHGGRQGGQGAGRRERPAGPHCRRPHVRRHLGGAPRYCKAREVRGPGPGPNHRVPHRGGGPGAGEVQRRGRGKSGNHRVSIGRHRGHSPQQKQKGMKCYG